MKNPSLSFSRTTILCLGSLICCSGQQQVLAAAPPASDGRPQSTPTKVQRFSLHLIAQFDRSQDGRLDASEWSPSGDTFQACDRDGNGTVTRGELSAFIFSYGKSRHMRLAPLPAAAPSTEPVDSGVTRAEASSPVAAERAPANGESVEQPANRKQATTRKYYSGSRSAAAPLWFTGRDRDGDGQLTLAEFAANGSGREKDFHRFDRNGDGLITVGELSGSVRRDE